jgi:uncharacterized protein YggL (DUF469 family)
MHVIWGNLTSTGGISLSMNLEDFQVALIKEIGSIRWTFKQATFEKKVDEAIKRVINGIKQESVKTMA